MSSFYHDGHGYISISLPGDPSSAYIVAATAKAALEKGVELTLPEGYDLEVLTNVCWILGTHYLSQRVSDRQAAELAAIGEQLISANAANSFQRFTGEIVITDYLRYVAVTS